MKKAFLQKGKFLLQLILPVLLLTSFVCKVSAMTDSEAAALSFAKDYLNSVQADLFQKGFLRTPTGNSVSDVQAALLASNSNGGTYTNAQNPNLVQNVGVTQQDLVQQAQQQNIQNQQQAQQQNIQNQPIPNSLVLDDGTTLSQNDLSKIKPPKPNEKSDYVTAIQGLLTDQGFLLGMPTGVFDQTTIDAVKSFQGYKGLRPTGVVDPGTLISFGQVSKIVAIEEKNNTHVRRQRTPQQDNTPVPFVNNQNQDNLNNQNQNQNTPNTARSNPSAISFARDYLNSIQNALVAKGYLGVATGVVDDATKAAIAKFQLDNNLNPTGVVDSKTGTLLLAPASQ